MVGFLRSKTAAHTSVGVGKHGERNWCVQLQIIKRLVFKTLAAQRSPLYCLGIPSSLAAEKWFSIPGSCQAERTPAKPTDCPAPVSYGTWMCAWAISCGVTSVSSTSHHVHALTQQENQQAVPQEHYVWHTQWGLNCWSKPGSWRLQLWGLYSLARPVTFRLLCGSEWQCHFLLKQVKGYQRLNWAPLRKKDEETVPA